jgi:hypothetical protein
MSDESAGLLLELLLAGGVEDAALGAAVFSDAIDDDTAFADDPIGEIEFICDQSICLSPHLKLF